MAPVIILIIAWWAGSGVVTRIRGARTSNPARPTANSTPASGVKPATPNAAAPTTGAARPRRTLAPGDVTFRQWQRSLYDRSKAKIRSHIPGQRLGKKATDLLGDVTAAALAGSLAFGMGFTLGGAWAGSRIAHRRTQKKTQPATGTPKNGPTGNSGRRKARTPGPGTPPGGTAGFNLGRRRTPQGQASPRGSADISDNTVLDFELLDVETPAPTTNSGQFSSTEYADVVLPELPAHPTSITTPNGHTMAAEILTIHDLFRWAKNAFTYATTAVEQSTVRANSAIERANHAIIRSSSATARAEKSIAVADTAMQHATQLEETAARFSTLRMDAASMSSIGVTITTAVGLAQTERRKAEAQAAVAEVAAALAAAEQIAAEAEQASAQAAILHGEAVKNMHDTVQLHQGPHSEAQAVTGNAAAHESVLAVN